MKVLVVDDTTSERMLLTSLLEQMGHQAIAAADGEKALPLYMSPNPQ